MRQRISQVLKFAFCCPSFDGHEGGLPLRVVCILGETFLEKTKFSFASGYQLETVPGLEMIGDCFHFFSSYWDPHQAQTCAGLKQDATVSVISIMYLPCCVLKTCFIAVLHFLCFYRLPASFSTGIFAEQGKGIYGDIAFRTLSRSLSPCTLSNWGRIICSHILQMEASPMMAQQNPDL